jgi:2-hydroxychromene-2-carboxylate isomerase
MTVDWYFDFVSPFAYFQFARLRLLPSTVEVRLQPVLLAGILGHWGQLGPAEIAPKRRFTYQYVTWAAARVGLPFTMPAGHPCNSLPLLRLAWTLGASRDVVARLFHFLWVDGHIPQEDAPWRALLTELGMTVYAETPAVKDRLRSTTDAAIGRGVFSVPTAIADGQLFWGDDATDMLLDYCRDPGMLDTPQMRRAVEGPVAAARPAKTP